MNDNIRLKTQTLKSSEPHRYVPFSFMPHWNFTCGEKKNNAHTVHLMHQNIIYFFNRKFTCK